MKLAFSSSFKQLPPKLLKTNRPAAAAKGESQFIAGLRRLRWLGVFFALSIPFALASSARAQNSVSVAWGANPEPDVAGYVVYLGTTSGVYPTIQDVGNTTTHVFSGLSSGTVYYCALQAYNTAGLMSELSDEISFTLQGSTEAFDSWAVAGSLSGSAAAPSAIPFHDGVPNVLKFAFNMNPGAADVRTLVKGTGTAGLPAYTLNGSEFTVEFLRRKDSGLVYRPKFSTNLGVYQTMTETPAVTDINAIWERVVIRKAVNTAATPKLFGTVEVTMP